MVGGGSRSSSSGDDDGDANWRAAIDSIAAVTDNVLSAGNQSKVAGAGSRNLNSDNDGEVNRCSEPLPKLYQIKAQKLLDEIIGKSIEIVRNPIPDECDTVQPSVGGIRLFRKAPPGVTLEPIDAHKQPRQRPRIAPGEEINEKSKEFKKKLNAAVVDGFSIMRGAQDACMRSMAKFEAREVAAKAAAKREEERVAELKRIRGEKWLPSIAKEMQRGTLQ